MAKNRSLEHLRQLREMNRITQSEMAKFFGFSRRSARKWIYERISVHENALILHGNNTGAGGRVPARKIADFGVECEVKIQECGSDPLGML